MRLNTLKKLSKASMCVIQGNTNSVANTEIFCFPAANGRDQVTVYSNAVSMADNHKDNAMILPIPRGYEKFKAIDLSEDADLFRKLDSCFPAPPLPRSLSAASAANASQGSFLQVQHCGSYEFSLVPSIRDFDRINPTVFQLNDDVRRLLASQYPRDFAFLVCKITENKKFHPVGYIHPMPADGQLFVPTLHFHQGHSEPLNPDWDHDIYVLGNDVIGRPARDFAALKQVSSLKRYMCLSQPEKLRKIQIKGHFTNRDITVPASADRSLMQMVFG